MPRWFQLMALAGGLMALVACGGPGPDEVTIGPEQIDKTSDRITANSEDFRTIYDRQNPVNMSLMVFGGHISTDKNAHYSLTLVGLPINKARRLQDKYPDFHKCNSPGASEAKKHALRLDMLVVEPDALDVLVKTVNKHKQIANSPAERLTVTLKGEGLNLAASILKGTNRDISGKLKPGGNISHNHLLVKAARQLDTRELLDQ